MQDHDSMALSKIECNNEGGWALWHITESIDALTFLIKSELCPVEIITPKKKLEWLASRALIQQLSEKVGLPFKGIYKDEFGKPFLKNNSAQISLSHSYPYVAAQLHFSIAVGIDIELPSEKLLRVAHRVFSAAEQQDAGINLTKNCVYWCAKEALYKLYGKRGISFSENIKVEPFSLMNFGELNGMVLTPKTKIEVALCYQIEKDNVVVYTKF